ncbi:MAG: hypothetical protein LBS49_11435, partial [Candidatus Accumulibacter sp.]|jgi:hypothetical protein|nr:hypothetical protein [Accumulibacter sp.]
LAAFGLLNPVAAGAAMALSSISVVSNSLLLNRWRPAAARRGKSAAHPPKGQEDQSPAPRHAPAPYLSTPLLQKNLRHDDQA